MCIYIYHYIYYLLFAQGFSELWIKSDRLSRLGRNFKYDPFQPPWPLLKLFKVSSMNNCSSFAWILPITENWWFLKQTLVILDSSNYWESFFPTWPETNRHPFSHSITSNVWRQLLYLHEPSLLQTQSTLFFIWKICRPLSYPSSLPGWSALVFSIHLKSVIPRMTLSILDAEWPL